MRKRLILSAVSPGGCWKSIGKGFALDPLGPGPQTPILKM